MNRKERKLAKRQRRFERLASEQDIRYRGPLSYRAFKLLGWICIILSQAAVLLSLEAKLDPAMTDSLKVPIQALNSVSSLALPFLLIANFALILNNSEGFFAQIRRYALLSGLVAAVAIFLFSRYAVGAVAILTGDRTSALALIQSLFWEGSKTRYLSFNIFTDLLLCSLLMFFLNYRPKRVFVGKKLGVFRAFAALPILYEVASIVLKLLASAGKLDLPVFVFPFLTAKPPITFLVFIVLAVFIKRRELRFLKNGKTHEEYAAFLATRRNSWDFSVFTAVTLAVAGILDLLATIVYISVAVISNGIRVEAVDVVSLLSQASGVGFGDSFPLLLLAPVMLLFSYTRTHRNKTPDLLIPAIGVVGVVIAYIEGLYQFFLMIPYLLDTPEFSALLEAISLPGLS